MLAHEDTTWCKEWVGCDFSTIGFSGLGPLDVEKMKLRPSKCFFARYRAKPYSRLPVLLRERMLIAGLFG